MESGEAEGMKREPWKLLRAAAQALRLAAALGTWSRVNRMCATSAEPAMRYFRTEEMLTWDVSTIYPTSLQARYVGIHAFVTADLDLTSDVSS